MSSDIKTVDLTLAIPLRNLGDERRAIDNKLRGMVSQYITEIDGVLLKWTDLNILNDKGIIIDDQPFVFYKVSFIAHVFKPIEGKLVKGKVHQMLKQYFIAKAIGSFTVTVSIPESLAEHATVQNLMVEQEVYFKIKGNSEGFYRGEIDEECIDLINGLVKQDRERDVYEYAKDFEY